MSQITQASSLEVFTDFLNGPVQRLKEVWEHIDEGCRDRIVLRFTQDALVFDVNKDDDTIDVHCTKSGSIDFSELRRADKEQPWSCFVGKSIGWGWTATNQQGYQDGILLSFEGFTPSVMLCAAASSAHVLLLNPVLGSPKSKSSARESNGHRTRTRRPNHR